MGGKGTESIWKFTIVICGVVALVAVLTASYGLHLTLGNNLCPLVYMGGTY